MAFTSFRFIVFLVLAAAAYFLTPKRCRWVTLFVANYVFYFISGGRIFIYLLATTVTTYLATVKIGDMAAKNKIAFNEAKAELDKGMEGRLCKEKEADSHPDPVVQLRDSGSAEIFRLRDRKPKSAVCKNRHWDGAARFSVSSALGHFFLYLPIHGISD